MTVLKEDITLKVEMIIDCFTFYNELDLLELRLEELDEHVDKFVIVEATTTHSGKDKDLYYAKNAHRYGFIRTVDTERWHWVFVGEGAIGKRFSKLNKTHGSWDGMGGHTPAKAKARARRDAAARRKAARQRG